MNAKPVLLVAAAVLVAGGLTFYFAGGASRSKEAAAPSNAPSIVDTKPTKAELTPKEIAATPAPEAIAAPTEVLPGVQVYERDAGNITYDRNTKTLTQSRNVLIRKPDGTVTERPILVTATPKLSPAKVAKRQPRETQAEQPRGDGKAAPASPAIPTPPADGGAPKKPFTK
jgi:hypothetical protein